MGVLMAGLWMKLYYNTLENPAIGKLSDHLYRRFMELYMIAGRESENGVLPCAEHLAWSLRASVKDIEATLSVLTEQGLLEINDGRYCFPDFQEQQETNLTSAERAQRYRNKRVTDAMYSDVTDATQDDVTSVTQGDVTDATQGDVANVTVDIDKIRIDKDKDEIRVDKDIKRIRAEKPERHRYGAYQHVLLSDDEITKLKARFPDYERWIEKLDAGIERKGYKYKNFYLTILDWARRDEEKQQPGGKNNKSFADIGREEGTL